MAPLMLRLLVYAVIAYIAWKAVRGELRRFMRPVQQPRTIAVDTVKCKRCGTYVAEGAPHECRS